MLDFVGFCGLNVVLPRSRPFEFEFEFRSRRARGAGDKDDLGIFVLGIDTGENVGVVVPVLGLLWCVLIPTTSTVTCGVRFSLWLAADSQGLGRGDNGCAVSVVDNGRFFTGECIDRFEADDEHDVVAPSRLLRCRHSSNFASIEWTVVICRLSMHTSRRRPSSGGTKNLRQWK